MIVPSQIPGVGEPWGIRILRLLWATNLRPATLAKIWGYNLPTLERIVRDGAPTRNRSAFVRALGQTERWYQADLDRLDSGEIQIFSKWQWQRVDLGKGQRSGVGTENHSFPEVGEMEVDLENFHPHPGSEGDDSEGIGDASTGEGRESLGVGREGVRLPALGSRRPKIGRSRIRLYPGGVAEVARVRRQYIRDAETGKGQWIWLIDRGEGEK